MPTKFPHAFVTLLLLTAANFASAVSPLPTTDLAPTTLTESDITIVDVSLAAEAGKRYLAGTVIDSPMATLCAILQDYPAYPRFMPNTDKVEIVKVDGKQTVLDMTLKLPLGKVKRYRLSMSSAVDNNACRLSWVMVARADLAASETIADTVGSWKLTPLPGNAQKTLVQYFVYSDPGPVPLGLGWIVDALGKESLPKTLEALRSRAKPKP